MEEFSYEIIFSQEIFNHLKQDDRFPVILALARTVNALRFCQKAAIDSKGIGGPTESRAIINSFLFAASVIYEGLRMIEKNRGSIEDLNSYKTDFEVFKKDSSIKKLRNTVLKKIRNQFVFHFDPIIMKKSLKNFELDLYVFAAGKGKAAGEMYFGLADEVAMNYIINPSKDDSKEIQKKRYLKIVQETTELMEKFTDFFERLIVEYMEVMEISPKKEKEEIINQG